MEALARPIAIIALSLVATACSLATESADGPEPGPVAVEAETATTAGVAAGANAGLDGGDVIACEPGGLDRPSGSIVAFYAQCVGEAAFLLHPVFRPDPGRNSTRSSAEAQLEARLEALVAGTTEAERAAGLSTGFDGVGEAAEIDVVATVSNEGEARIEFFIEGDEWTPGSRAGTSAQLFSFLDPLLATTFDDRQIRAINLDDLCWGEMGCGAGLTTRADWEAGLFINAGAVIGAHCDLAGVWADPARCTVDGAIDAATGAARVVDVADDDTLNLRAGPGVDYPVVGEARPNTVVVVAERAAEAADGGVWRLIDDNGTAGWANGAFLDISEIVGS